MVYMLAGTNESVTREVKSDVGCVFSSHVRSGIGISPSAHWVPTPMASPQARGSLDRLANLKEMET